MARKGQEFTWDDFPVRKDAAGWHCRRCKVLLKGRKTAWCSKECLAEVRSLCDWNYIRNKVRRRDKYRCQMPVEGPPSYFNVLLPDGRVICGRPARDVDHIIELADGGCFHDLKNLRALCHGCHQKKTLAARKARADRKKLERKLAKKR